jgi:cation:H+ antiporter
VLLAWGKFFGLLLLVYIFGTRVTRSADIIAEKKGLARAFMGVVFISMITSFPELFTGISAAAIVGSADLAIGEIIGSCIFNLFIIALIDGIFRKHNLYSSSGKGNILPLGFSFIMIAVLTFALSAGFDFKILNVGYYSVALFIFYIIFIRVIFKERKAKTENKIYQQKNLKKEIIQFALSGVIIIAVGIYLPIVGKEIAEIMNWRESFVGVIFLAFVTSFPELIVSISTARIGAFDMFLGNIIGSNLFNVAIVFAIDIFYLKGDVLSFVSKNNVSAGIIAMIMNFVVFFAVVRGSRRKIFNFVSINAIILLVLFVLNIFILF